MRYELREPNQLERVRMDPVIARIIWEFMQTKIWAHLSESSCGAAAAAAAAWDWIGEGRQLLQEAIAIEEREIERERETEGAASKVSKGPN